MVTAFDSPRFDTRICDNVMVSLAAAHKDGAHFTSKQEEEPDSLLPHK